MNINHDNNRNVLFAFSVDGNGSDEYAFSAYKKNITVKGGSYRVLFDIAIDAMYNNYDLLKEICNFFNDEIKLP